MNCLYNLVNFLRVALRYPKMRAVTLDDEAAHGAGKIGIREFGLAQRFVKAGFYLVDFIVAHFTEVYSYVMLISPASNASVPLPVVTRTRSRVADNDFDPLVWYCSVLSERDSRP